MSLYARLRHAANPREQTMTIYGYARVSGGRDDGTDTLQNQRMRLTGAGVDAAHLHQDIITGTVMQRLGVNGLLNACTTRRRTGGDRAGPAGTRYAGSPGADQLAGHHGRGTEGAGYAG